MDEAVQVISEALGPKWVYLYGLLGMDYRGRFQIQSKWSQKDGQTRHRNCAFEMLQKWKQKNRERDEIESLEELLNAVNRVKGMQRTASTLASKNGMFVYSCNLGFFKIKR